MLVYQHNRTQQIQVSPTCTKRLCPPGTAFMMCRSIRSFSSTATPASIRIGGGVESKFDLGMFLNSEMFGKEQIEMVWETNQHLAPEVGWPGGEVK